MIVGSTARGICRLSPVDSGQWTVYSRSPARPCCLRSGRHRRGIAVASGIAAARSRIALARSRIAAARTARERLARPCPVPQSGRMVHGVLSPAGRPIGRRSESARDDGDAAVAIGSNTQADPSIPHAHRAPSRPPTFGRGRETGPPYLPHVCPSLPQSAPFGRPSTPSPYGEMGQKECRLAPQCRLRRDGVILILRRAATVVMILPFHFLRLPSIQPAIHPASMPAMPWPRA